MWALVEAARLREIEGLAFPVGTIGKGCLKGDMAHCDLIDV